MLNDRDDKYEGQEESEYHFSDDEVSYEVEPDKPTAASKPKLNFLSRLSGARRMLISLVIFLILVFVVYKMVAPETSAPPSTDITAPHAVAKKGAMSNVSPLETHEKVVSTTSTTTNVLPVKHVSPSPSPAVAIPTAPSAVATVPENTIVRTTRENPQAVVVTHQEPTKTTVSVQQISPTVNQPTEGQVPSTAPSVSPGVTALPQVSNPQANAEIANIAKENEKLINQLQIDYTQKLNAFTVQTKTLQDQLHTLNVRIASMENQMNQLIQALTTHGATTKTETVVESEPLAPPPIAKINYTVQAIIPGRAWLKSGNGETVTVAEGDMIRGVGRVTKIDPYDGLVEINTGNKVISISYGSGE